MLQAWLAHGEQGGEAVARVPKIGPNAVIQLAAALKKLGLGWLTAPVFADAGVMYWLLNPPREMIDARRAARVHRSVRQNVPADEAAMILSEAGRLTADYLLAHRIPASVQALLKRLPSRLAVWLLAHAMKSNAWTFVGGGQFSVHGWRALTLEIRGNPLCAEETADHTVCSWHAAVFQRLFDAVAPNAVRVIETACEARGDECCRFFVMPI